MFKIPQNSSVYSLRSATTSAESSLCCSRLLCQRTEAAVVSPSKLSVPGRIQLWTHQAPLRGNLKHELKSLSLPGPDSPVEVQGLIPCLLLHFPCMTQGRSSGNTLAQGKGGWSNAAGKGAGSFREGQQECWPWDQRNPAGKHVLGEYICPNSTKALCNVGWVAGAAAETHPSGLPDSFSLYLAVTVLQEQDLVKDL